MSRTLFLFLLLLPFFQLHSQTLPVADYLKVWSRNDIKQTQEAAVLFDDLSSKKDPAKYYQLVKELEQRIDPVKEPRLFIRLSMYKALWSMETQAKQKQSIQYHHQQTLAAIRLAYPLKDKQLNAELYALFGELSLRLPDLEQSLLYNLRSLDMQEQIGQQYFPKICWTYFSVARSLYHTRDYAQSVKYGLKCVEALKKLPAVSRYDRIFLADIIGSAYDKTGKKDSAAMYYRQIRQLITEQDPAHSETLPRWNALWLGLTDGYLGRIDKEKREHATATPLLQNAVQSSLQYGDTANAACFLNDLAGIHYQQKQFPQALAKWKQAFRWSTLTHEKQAIADAALGLSQVFRDLQQPDSSYFYFGQYHVVNDSLTALINRSQLNAARAKLDYEQLQESLAKAEEDMQSERGMKKLLVAAIAFLVIIAAFSWYRISTRHKRRSALHQKKIRQVQQKEAEARTKLEQFKSRIDEKNEEIEALQQQLSQSAQFNPIEVYPSVLLTEDDWVNFKNDFIKAYPNFFPALRLIVNNLTPAQERLAALIKLNFDNAQAAACLGISKDSVGRGKRRLRQSINLPADTSLEDFIISIR